MIKYLENLTSETFSHNVNKTLRFPSITLCPFFKLYTNRFEATEGKFPPTMQSLGLLDFSHVFDNRYAVFLVFFGFPAYLLISNVRNITRGDFNDTSIFVPTLINNLGDEEHCFTYNPPEFSRVGFDLGRVS